MTNIDAELVVFDDKLSLNEGAIRAGGWNFSDRSTWARGFIEALSARYKFSLDEPFRKLPKKIRDIILFGNNGEVLEVDTINSKFSRGIYRSAWIGVVNSLEKRYRETARMYEGVL
jgi:excinuclease ABC subunit A